MAVTADPLAAGRDAIARHAWSDAFELLRAADAEGRALEPGDLEALAEAAWWTARLDDCIAARERAFAAYSASGNSRAAARVAMALAKDYYAKGASSIGSAWMNRAERLLADEPESIEHGWLHRLRSVIALEGAGDYERALEEGRNAYELATRFGDRELAAVALHDEGRALVMSGAVADGMALIDEATAPATTGELSPHNTALVYCNTITACKELADYRRAGDWSDAAKRWCERQAIAGFPGMCRVYRASIMQLRGAWAEAELEARQACEELKDFNVSYAAEAFYELGEIRLRAGDLDAAEEAFRQAHELGRDPQPGLAILRLAQGRMDGARSCIGQALADEGGDLHRARLLPAQVEIAVAADDHDAADAATRELERIAETYGSDALAASAHGSRARLAFATGDPHTAIREARQAVRGWQAIDAPYEAARARVLLGDAYLAVADEEDASLELQAATVAFERLGAVRDARATRERLGRLERESVGAGGSDGKAVRTFVFTDIVRSTNLVEAIGDEAWTDLVAWHDKTLRSLFAAHGGEEVDHAGDGFFVAFREPASAVECAITIQRSLADHRREHGFAPQVRIGVHATEAARQGPGYRGRGVHEAARIAGVAAGSEIVASRETAEAARGFAASPPRTVELKGIGTPIEVVSIEWR
jgi:class 3 adenylate cyclase